MYAILISFLYTAFSAWLITRKLNRENGVKYNLMLFIIVLIVGGIMLELGEMAYPENKPACEITTVNK